MGLKRSKCCLLLVGETEKGNPFIVSERFRNRARSMLIRLPHGGLLMPNAHTRITAHNDPALRNRMLQEEAKPQCDQWTEWSSCSKSCGMGVRLRVRASSKKEHSRECSKITETAVCFMDNCIELKEVRERDEMEQNENERKTVKRKYLLIFGIFSAINIVILLVCVILSIKKKVI
ncbi:hypothetical protein PCYB_021990 [Plasmodium cynomolgi strain B]|uniref:CCN TSP1 domain-containing protein n=1 Tax=Plasmodium cynomolgi (strain B) TaxID=1120755 RepID=K6UPP8_PLACD|nr:hypothetical protein PCYB_021990 [Plasmodium cynomolgi strain B]GAB64629.1 hypothetical protein PCYB_021990 [Plasmodium cynomolgi strain B]